MADVQSAPQIRGARKAAILMALLGEEGASAVFRNLSEEDVQRVTEELSSLGNVPVEVSQQILQEYYQLALTQEYLAQGGPEFASRTRNFRRKQTIIVEKPSRIVGDCGTRG